jgi:pyrrolidone-carboxylate peptidase
MFDQVYLTGFKKFGNHEFNPTEMISEHFAKQAIPGLECDVVEVAVEPVDAYIDKIKHKIAELPGKKILNVHFGVGPNKVYHL